MRPRTNDPNGDLAKDPEQVSNLNRTLGSAAIVTSPFHGDRDRGKSVRTRGGRAAWVRTTLAVVTMAPYRLSALRNSKTNAWRYAW